MTRLHRSEAGAEGARRIARAQLAEALGALEQRPLSDKAVHSARKSLKKARAMLRLLRSSIGEDAYHRENATLRDIARPLSEIRDARILLQALVQLTRQYRAHGHAVGVAELQRLLYRKRANLWTRLRREAGPFAPQREALREARCRARHWRVGRGGWSVLGPSLARVYRQTRRALARARAEPTAENLHEWRKQTKYLWHQLQVLEPLGATVAQRATMAHHLADALGDDHDLWVLRATVTARVPARAGRQGLLGLIDRRSAQRRAQAFSLGRQLLAEPPKIFEARLHALWRAWRRRPA